VLDLGHLEVFQAVAREGRWSRAAEKMFRTQSAVIQSIRNLDNMGEPLFDRSSREGNSYDAGRVLSRYAERLLNLSHYAKRRWSSYAPLHKATGDAPPRVLTVSICCRCSPCSALAPMIKNHGAGGAGRPDPDDVLRHNVGEFGVLTYDPQDAHLHRDPVYQMSFDLRGSPAIPPAKAKQVSSTAVGAETFVAHCASPYREQVLRAFKRHKTPSHGYRAPRLASTSALWRWEMERGGCTGDQRGT